VEAKNQWVKRVLGLSVPATGTGGEPESIDPAFLSDWLDDMSGQAASLPEQDRAAIQARLKQTRTALAAGPGAAIEALNALAMDIARAAGEARATEARTAGAAFQARRAQNGAEPAIGGASDAELEAARAQWAAGAGGLMYRSHAKSLRRRCGGSC